MPAYNPPTWAGGAPNLRVGPFPQSFLGLHCTSRAGQWSCGAHRLHSDEGPDRGDAPLQ